jgi:dipeptidyl aminopeptidase/acylaminoacyl peptidase
MRHVRLALVPVLLALAWAAPASAELVYVKDPAGAATVFIAADDASSPRELAKGTQPVIAPDARTVALLRARGSQQELWLVPAGGGEGRRLAISRSVESVTYSPDASLLAAEIGGRRLMVFEVGTGRSATLVRGFVKGLSFSPDGQRIAFGRGSDATARGASDVQTVSVLGGDPVPLTDDGRSLLPVWGPDRIAFVKQKAASRGGAIPAYDIWTMTAEGNRVRRLTTTKVPEGVSGLLPVEYSADGRRLIAQYVGADVRVGFTVNPFTGRTRALRRKVAFDLTGDGSAVLTHSGGPDPAAKHNVYAAPYGGGPSVLLVRNAAFPDWSR